MAASRQIHFVVTACVAPALQNLNIRHGIISATGGREHLSRLQSRQRNDCRTLTIWMQRRTESVIRQRNSGENLLVRRISQRESGMLTQQNTGHSLMPSASTSTKAVFSPPVRRPENILQINRLVWLRGPQPPKTTLVVGCSVVGQCKWAHVIANSRVCANSAEAQLRLLGKLWARIV